MEKASNKSISATDVYTVLPTVVVDRINFMAELPDDFWLPTRVYQHDYERKHLPYIGVDNVDKAFNKESYRIEGNKIYFSGGFSRWWLIRLIQKWWDKKYPAKYKMEYVTAKMREQLL